MKRIKLDKIDLQILSDLQTNGRMTNVELAKRAGISAPPCLRRVKSLEEQGFIQGYYAQLDPSLMGYGVCIFAMVSLSSQADTDLAKFKAWTQDHHNIREVHMLSGDIDFLLKIVAKDWDEYQEFLGKALTAAPFVSKVKSSLAIEMTKNDPGIPVSVK